ncbi:MAG: ComF family protein [Bryobacteraceae bacterium]
MNEAPLAPDGLCPLCRDGLTGFDAAYTYGGYEGALRRLIHVFKYDGVTTLAEPLGRLLARALPRDIEFDLVVPAPMHWRRRWSRGFNQAELLAREIGRRISVPVKPALRRGRNTPSQAGLTSAARRRNLAGAFRVSDPKKVAGKHVLLVDDVLTTGTTAAVCARALKRAGAARVTVLTLARADRRYWTAEVHSGDAAIPAAASSSGTEVSS